MALGRWATVVGLSMTPALVAGPMAACAAGIGFGLDPRVMLPVVACAGFVEGVIVAWLAGQSLRIGFVNRFMDRMRGPRALALAEKWGVWGGLIIGVAIVGQEPILVALRARHGDEEAIFTARREQRAFRGRVLPGRATRRGQAPGDDQAVDVVTTSCDIRNCNGLHAMMLAAPRTTGQTYSSEAVASSLSRFA
jgi:hypothetical protein